MKAHLTIAGGSLTFELTAETPKDLFEQISSVQEVFEAETSCGCCDGDELRFLARQVDDFKFYEIACQNPDCRARFAFGQAKKGGGLFPKRKDEDGNWLPNRGWSKYQPKTEGVGNGHAAAPQAAKAAPPTQERQNGMAKFPDWGAAESSPAWGEPWVSVAGVVYKLNPAGTYMKHA